MVKDIISGTINNVLNRKVSLYWERIQICRQCKLITKNPIFGEICNDKLWLNPETDEISNYKKDGYRNGCSCILSSKTRVEEAKCPLGKW